MVISFQHFEDDDKIKKYIKPYQVEDLRFQWSGYMIGIFGKGTWKFQNCERE